jgi:hypothetical protein
VSRSFIFSFTVGISLSLAIYAYATVPTKTQIWLPISYQAHYPRLMEAYDQVRETDDCYEVLSGTLSESLSKNGQIVFVFRCRTEDRQVFSINVNAKTLTMVNNFALKREAAELAEKKRQEEEEKRIQKEEKERLQEELRQKLAEREQYWSICQQAFETDIQFFNKPKVITPFPARPDITADGVFTYLIEFQTLSIKKNILSYIATATIHSLEACTIKIRPL